ncbi:HD domain-containing protein [Clostridium sp. DJ247]|uniref:HD domain-containing protein n=1 Tax=Clostridium sp. DJ247 TaxID=2726188 RepID=UPI001628FA2D|nr:HD domain-containing protein [Clostridium sp. DJ247]MBC2580778.1 HD domain-containing protein [Clostridium sp. DJ247]
MYEDMINYVKKFLDNRELEVDDFENKYPFRIRFQHILRVYNWTHRLNEFEKGDEQVVSIAAIFHDVGKRNDNSIPHADLSAEICSKYLESINYDKNQSKRIIQAIKKHSSKKECIEKLSLEDRILIDADLLDEVGAITVLWDSMATVMETDPSYMKVYERLQKRLERIKKKSSLTKTKTGARFYEERLRFLENFIENLEYELQVGFDR